MSLLLAQRGYQVTAVDLSEQRLTVASEKDNGFRRKPPGVYSAGNAEAEVAVSGGFGPCVC